MKRRKTETETPFRLDLDDELKSDARLVVRIDPDEEAAIAEANALPGPPILDMAPFRPTKPRRWVAVVSLAISAACLFLSLHFRAPAILAFALAPTGTYGLSTQRCTFADGSSEPGTCMLVADFYTRANGASLLPFATHDDYDGPLQNVTPDLGCFRHENANIVAGVGLQLAITSNSRSPCPQSWSASAAYNSTACGGSGCAASWPVPANTTFDEAYVDSPTFLGTYGHITFAYTASGGTGPGTDFSLWGANCQSAGGVIGMLATGLFTLTGTCNWPASGSQEFDLYQYAHLNGNQNSSSYRAAGNGAPAMSTFFGTPYFGYIFTNQPGVPFGAATTFSPNTVPADPTTGTHIAEVEWEPGLTWVKLDGIQIAYLAAPYVSSESKFPMVWNALVAAPSGGFPQTLTVKWYHWVCPPGVPCTWTGP